MKHGTCLWVVLALMAASAQGGTRWPQFRGENAQGLAEGEKPPVEFGPAKNLLWKTPLPPGHSSPCVWDDRIFLTAYEKNRLETICIQRSDGKVLWRQVIPVEKVERLNRVNSPAAPTPTTDGQRVYIYCGSFGLVAYDMDGREQWRKPLPVPEVRHGTGTSPILAGGKLILNGDQEEFRSFLLAVDPKDGRTIWQTPRTSYLSSHSTPVCWTRDGVDELVVAGCIRVVGYDLKDGSERWSCRGLEAVSICPTPAIGDGMLFAMSQSLGEQRVPPFPALMERGDKNKDGKLSPAESPQYVRELFSILDINKDGLVTAEEFDKHFAMFQQAQHGLFAMRAPDKGDVTATHTLWRQTKGVSVVSSPLYYRGRVYVVRDGGFASCFEAKSGKPLYQMERIAGRGAYYASPVAADGRIYLASMSGTVCVLAAGDELKVLACNELGEAISATPAIVDNTMYVRSAGHLWAFGERP